MVGFKAWDAVRSLGARSAAAVLFGVVLVGGCAGKSTGSDSPDAADPCPAVCEAGRKCPAAPPLTMSCDDYCLGQDFVATATNCHDLYERSLACSEKLKNICTALTDCAAEVNAAHNCEVAFCNGHPDVDLCVTVM